MPMYTYVCPKCDKTQEHLAKCHERVQSCECGGWMERRGLEIFAMGKPAYQMAGILGDGTHVPGHFGKNAKRDKSKRKKKS